MICGTEYFSHCLSSSLLFSHMYNISKPSHISKHSRLTLWDYMETQCDLWDWMKLNYLSSSLIFSPVLSLSLICRTSQNPPTFQNTPDEVHETTWKLYVVCGTEYFSHVLSSSLIFSHFDKLRNRFHFDDAGWRLRRLAMKSMMNGNTIYWNRVDDDDDHSPEFISIHFSSIEV